MSILNKAKHWLRDMFRYPAMKSSGQSYDGYWSVRDMNALNSFQRRRAEYLLNLVSTDSSVLDVGCGDGRILAYLKERRPDLKLSGIDSSPAALKIAAGRGIDVSLIDLRKADELGRRPADFIILFEVLEHMSDSEGLLRWATENARHSVVFSVPNTGFITHRLRLLLGRFPLQWRADPAEHLRFWTMSDMAEWLKGLGFRYQLRGYEGVPYLCELWPSLFAEGLMVSLPTQGE